MWPTTLLSQTGALPLLAHTPFLLTPVPRVSEKLILDNLEPEAKAPLEIE